MAYLVYLGLAIIGLTLQATQGCQDGWETFDGACYLVFDMRKDWMAASQTCSLHNGHLAEVTDNYEDNFLKQIIKQHHDGIRNQTHFWLGGNDISHEGEWRWTSTGQRFNYTNWYPGQPINHQDQDCLLAHFRGNHHIFWEDWDCTSKFNFVCKTGGKWVQFG